MTDRDAATAEANRLRTLYDANVRSAQKHRSGAPIEPEKKLATPLPVQALAPRPHSVR